MPYILPENLTPPGRRCVRFFIPTETWYEAAFWGALTELANTFNWEGSDEDREVVTELWEEIIETARESWQEGDCELPVQFRVVNGRTEYSPDSGATWVDIGDACGCSSQLVSPEYNPDAPTYEDRACAIAIGLTNWLMDKMNDEADLIEAAVDTVGAMDSILAIFPPGYLIADAILDAISEVTEAGAAGVRAWDTVERREEISSFLYCPMRETGELTEAMWDSFVQAIQDNEFAPASPYNDAVWLIMKAYEYDAIQARARIESYGDQNCAILDCGDEWEQEFDFTTGQQGWSPTPDRCAYTPGVGWTQVAVSGVRTEVRPFIDFTSTVITHIDFDYYADPTGAIANWDIRIVGQPGSQVLAVDKPAPDYHNFSWDGEQSLTGIRLQLWPSSNGDLGGQAIIMRAVVRGKGTNPFIP